MTSGPTARSRCGDRPDPEGQPVRYLAGPPSRVDTVSATVRHGDTLYVSTLTGDAILRLQLVPAA
ncbi:MAG: hypothetical protein DLM58_22830 [Pseudonocardiales bacterium]|nr:MAG: hypothetical protein DLM58_22830 [Pseudonocardiales bacterium]